MKNAFIKYVASPRKDCGKASFDTEKEALSRLTHITEEGEDREKKPTRVYECAQCGKFHLTSQDKEYYEERHEKRLKRLTSEWEERLGVKERFKKPRKKK